MSDAYSARAALGVPDDVEMSEEECQAAARSEDADEPPEWVFERVAEKPGDEDCGEWVAF